MMLAAARNTPDLTYDNAKISLYPNYSPEVPTLLYRDPKTSQGAWLKPSNLWIIEGGTLRYFDTPAAAETWLESC